MATDQVSSPEIESRPAPQVQPWQAWLARLGLSGKLMAAGGLIGLIAVFLPLLTISMQIQSSLAAKAFGGKAGVSLPATSQSVMVVSDWKGVICLLGYAATVALAVFLYPPKGLNQKTLAWAGVGVGGLIALLSIWLLFSAFNGSGGISGFGFQISVGFGAILNLLTAAAVAAGGVIKAREENLI